MLVVPPVLFGGYSLHRAFNTSASIPEVAVWLLFAAAMLILLAIQVAFPVAGIIGDWWSRIYFPGETATPLVSYLLAELYEQEHRWELTSAVNQLHHHRHCIEAGVRGDRCPD